MSKPPPTSVTTMTTNTVNKIRSRCGKFTGSASAAASETTPRIPAVPMMNVTRQDGGGPSSAVERGASARRRRDTPNSHAKRAAMTTAAIPSDQAASVAGRYTPKAPTIVRNCRPTRTNAAPLKVKNNRFQTADAAMRLFASKIRFDLRLRTMPPLSAASTPEAWTASAGTYSANGVTSEIETEMSSSDKPLSRIFAAIQPDSAPPPMPIAIPATTTYTNCSSANPSENAPVSTAVTAKA